MKFDKMNEIKFKYNNDKTKIIIPEGTTIIPDEAFMDLEKVEEIVIPDSVEHIGKGAFKGCKSLKKINLPNSLVILDDFAFSECESLKEITIPTSLHYFSCGVFSHCYNLEKVNTHEEIDFINDLAFFKCKKLKEFEIPSNVQSIHRMAFMGCESIKTVNIPKKVECIEYGAFSLMNSLEKITVAKENKNFLAVDEDTALLSKDGLIIQYAINCDREDFIVGYYVSEIENTTIQDGAPTTLEINSLVYNIADYAFANAKKLKKISIASELEGIGGKTFQNCENLKDLEIFHSNYGDSFLIQIHKPLDEEAEIPFENITIEEGIKTLCGNLSDLFKNAKNIDLPDSLEHISENVFLKSNKLSEITIPKNIKMIFPNTFYPEISLEFQTFGLIKAQDFNMLQTKTNENYYRTSQQKDNVKIFSLTDGTSYVSIADFDTIKISRDEIKKISNSSHIMCDNPDDFVLYIIDLLSINVEHNRLLTKIWLDPNLEKKFNEFVSDCNYIQEIATNRISRVIREMLETSGIYDELLFNGIIMRKLNKEEIIKLISNYSDSISRFFRLGKFDEDINININKIIRYCNLLEKYQNYDRFLYNPIFSEKLSYKNQEQLIKHLNKNLKRLILNSQTLDDYYGENLNDLLNLCTSLGVFSNEKRLSQKSITFLSEKIVNEDSTTPIVGDTIHTIFSDLKPREEIDYEYILFFIENYKNLFELEKEKSGIIARIYNSFNEISKTSTSHRGSQRHLKVTMEKCKDYFLAKKFIGVNENNKNLARFLQNFYSESYILSVAEKLLEQCQEAPRNIFSEVKFQEDTPIFSYDRNEDLIEHNEESFSYHWLPKQDYDNLVLGKYCNCCAHILGAGAGIMRASMILDNCQNLVIRNKAGTIIAKMTIYVNKSQGYAVYNTAEINLSYRDDASLEGIYQAFMRGTKAFLDRYNKNNEIPISIVSIGQYRNFLKDNLGNIETKLLVTPDFSSYSYYVNDKIVGTYDGDSKNKQLLVLKK